MKTAIRNHAAAALLLFPLAAAVVATPAHAQQYRVAAAQPAISSLALNSSSGLAPGAVLRLQVYATPGARQASVALGDSGIRVIVREQSPGNYLGTYTVRRGDRLDPRQPMTARATYGERIVTSQVSYPPSFQALAMGGPATGPAIERFVMNPRGRIEPGRELRFRLVGVPGADAWLDIPGVIRGIDLAETRPGVYEGTYTVRRRDDVNAFARAVATLRAGNQRSIARVEIRGGDDVGQGPARDILAPSISDVTPGDGVRVDDHGRVHVFARLGDEGSGVDPATVRLRIDGRDVTGAARISAEEVRFRDDLPNGRHTAELEVRDRAGNAARKAWSFDVVDNGGNRDGRRS
ncbi:MAG: hypothetical protein JWQ76_3360 [Ramlibacter sp.]|nr:hypothetical protein [Ramlibacter sp.]